MTVTFPRCHRLRRRRSRRFLTRELELFFELVAEVVAEEGEPRDFIIKQLAELERDVNFAEAS
jgi:hypothetical protein